MNTFEPISLDPQILSKELGELAKFLALNRQLKERAQVLPFFKKRKQLCAAISMTNGDVVSPDKVATDLRLFEFICDAAGGDSKTNAYTLIEFEPASEGSVLTKPKRPGQTKREWSPRFEHGFSQLVDWAWRLTIEGSSSSFYRKIFGKNNANIRLLLIAGREADLDDDDSARVQWRAREVHLGAFQMQFYTFDGVLKTLQQRLEVASRLGEKPTKK
jgi:Domain of unknown function (DUF4263)